MAGARRQDLLGRLDSLLTAGDGPHIVVLCGLGGVGKTSLAVEYAHRHLAEAGVVWQGAARDPAGPEPGTMSYLRKAIRVVAGSAPPASPTEISQRLRVVGLVPQ